MDKVRRFLKDPGAVTTVEFVVIFPFFVIIAFYALQVVLAIFWWQSVEEAAQLGARLAATWDPAVTVQSDCSSLTSGELPVNNCKTSGGIYGGSCTDNCVDYGTVSCTGGTGGDCNSDTTAFNTICARMQSLFAPIQCSDVTISYSYSGLGFAGGPVLPNIAVSLTGVPFDVLRVPFLPNVTSIVPPMVAMLTGEDLSSSGGSS